MLRTPTPNPTINHRSRPALGASGHRPPALIEVRSLTRVWGKGDTAQVAVDHVDLTIGAGELVAIVQNLLFAGHDTTRSLLQIAMAIAVDNPIQADLLRRDLSHAAPFVAEVLRWEPPVFGTARLPSVAVDLGTVVIQASEPVSFALPAANRDPRRYPQPHDFDPGRWADPGVAGVLSFGYGIHYCVGAALARMEAEVAIPLALSMLPELTLDARPEWVPYASIRRYESLPASFTAVSIKPDSSGQDGNEKL